MSSNLSFAQSTDYKCTYNATTPIPESVQSIADPAIKDAVIQKLSALSQSYELFISNDVALFESTSNNNEGVMSIGSSGNVYLNRKEKISVSVENIMDRKFLITEELIDQAWNITTETKKIGDKPCKLALLKSNPKIRAWFSIELPISFGPAGYYGLPGLIMELETPTKIYTLQGITKLADKSQLQKPTDGKKISREEFESLKAKKQKELGISNENKGGVQIITM